MFDRRLCATALVLIAGVSVLEVRGFGRLGTATQLHAAGAKDPKENAADIAKQEIELAKECSASAEMRQRAS